MQLSDAQIADFDRDGYLFIPDLFSQAEVDRLTADVPRIFSLDRQEILRAFRDSLQGYTYFEHH